MLHPALIILALGYQMKRKYDINSNTGDKPIPEFLDFSGSGAETLSHVYENGRVTLLFCSFTDQPPRILRPFRTGRVVEYDDVSRFERVADDMGKRKMVQTSCGYAVPILNIAGDAPGTNTGPSNFLDQASP
ncbi:hypothetical protein F4775DRAFT_596572 [Biscogniauxia sp. FL1348]|nr:hypothetical protein F4775DRAFT_596572 [Biscogniauxia sp. FL1348]